jgi:tRNA(Ile)-lysidine synthase
LRQARIPFADDPSNRNPQFLRARLRKLAPGLEQEGIDAAKLSLLARRLARANAAIEQVAAEEWKRVFRGSSRGMFEFDAPNYFALPAEIALRLLGRAIDDIGHEGPAELRKLESLQEALAEAEAGNRPLKRTLAGATIDFDGRRISIDSAPARRKPRPRTSARAR